MKKEQFDAMLSKASKSVQNLNRDIARECPSPSNRTQFTVLDSSVPPYSSQALERSINKPSKRIRQSTKPTSNKLESEFGDYLHSVNWKGHSIYEKPITFRLANGVRYTPDWVVFGDHLRCYEVKGPHAWDDSIVKLKVAPSTYRDVHWYLVWKSNGEWLQQPILP